MRISYRNYHDTVIVHYQRLFYQVSDCIDAEDALKQDSLSLNIGLFDARGSIAAERALHLTSTSNGINRDSINNMLILTSFIYSNNGNAKTCRDGDRGISCFVFSSARAPLSPPLVPRFKKIKHENFGNVLYINDSVIHPDIH